MIPRSKPVYSSPPANSIGDPPALAKTAPPRPGILIFKPFRSEIVFISLLNQPPICTPVLPAGSGIKPKLAYNSCHKAKPSPASNHEDTCWAFMPKGTVAKNEAAGDFPAQ